MARRAIVQEVAAPPAVCPHLGSVEGDDIHEDQPSRQHRCFFTKPPQRIDVAHQRAFCLSSSCVGCPWLTVDEPVAKVLAEEPADFEKVEKAAGKVAKGFRVVAGITAPIVKEAATRAAGAVQDAVQEGAAAVQNAKSQAAPPAASPPNGNGHARAAAKPPAPEPPPYRIVTPERKATIPGSPLAKPAIPFWKKVVGRAAPELGGTAAFLAALFWLSGIYQGWVPAGMVAPSFWPVFQLPAIPFSSTVGLLSLTFDVGTAIPLAIGALWVWVAFGLLNGKGPDWLTACLLSAGSVIALNRLVVGGSASQIALLCQILPSLFVLVARATGESARRSTGWER